MAGILTHILIGLVSGAVIYSYWGKLEFFFSTLLGNIVVDTFKFVTAAVRQGTWKIFGVSQDSQYWAVAELTSSSAHWFALGFFLLTLVALLYQFHYIKKKKLIEYDELIWSFLIGVTLHLITDAVINEGGPWV